jgi:hypothetical protein
MAVQVARPVRLEELLEVQQQEMPLTARWEESKEAEAEAGPVSRIMAAAVV